MCSYKTKKKKKKTGVWDVEMDLMQAISQVGFPIAVSIYSLVVLNNSIKEHSQVIADHTKVMAVLCDRVGVEANG